MNKDQSPIMFVNSNFSLAYYNKNEKLFYFYVILLCYLLLVMNSMVYIENATNSFIIKFLNINH